RKPRQLARALDDRVFGPDGGLHRRFALHAAGEADYRPVERRRKRIKEIMNRQTERTHRMCPRPNNNQLRRPSFGFTLVEMLVVITIIGILASLAAVGVYKAYDAARRARIKIELTNLANAMEAFKQKYGDYPPSNVNSSDPNSKMQVEQFLAKAFPRCN